MNPEFPHLTREELEVRLTALLLGELPPAEAEAVRQLAASDAALGQMLARLETAIQLVREGLAAPGEAAPTTQEQLKLAPEKREQLLAQFKQPPAMPGVAREGAKEAKVTPEQMGVKRIQPKRGKYRWLAATSVTVAVMALLAGLLFPTLATSKKKSQRLLARSTDRGNGVQDRMEFRLWEGRQDGQALQVAGVPPPAPDLTLNFVPAPPPTAAEPQPERLRTQIALPPATEDEVVKLAGGSAGNFAWGGSGPSGGGGAGGRSGGGGYGGGHNLLSLTAAPVATQPAPTAKPSKAVRSFGTWGSDEPLAEELPLVADAINGRDDGADAKQTRLEPGTPKPAQAAQNLGWEAAGDRVEFGLPTSGQTWDFENRGKVVAGKPAEVAAKSELTSRMESRGRGTTAEPQDPATELPIAADHFYADTDGLASRMTRSSSRGGNRATASGTVTAPTGTTEALGRRPARPAVAADFGGVADDDGIAGRKSDDFATFAGAEVKLAERKEVTRSSGGVAGAAADRKDAGGSQLAGVALGEPGNRAPSFTGSAAPATPPVALRLPMPTLKGTPEDLPIGANVEAIDKTQAEQLAKWSVLQSSASEAAPAPEVRAMNPEMQTRFARRYGMSPPASAPAPATKDDTKKSVATLGDTPMLGALFNAKTAEPGGERFDKELAQRLDGVSSGVQNLYASVVTNSVAAGGGVFFDEQKRQAGSAWFESRAASQSGERYAKLSSAAIVLPGLNGQVAEGQADLGTTTRELREQLTLNYDFQPTAPANGPVVAGRPISDSSRVEGLEKKLALSREAEAPASADDFAKKKRELEEAIRFRNILALKTLSEETDADLPKSSVVEIVDAASPAAKPSASLWERAKQAVTGEPDQYESKARIRVERDVSDIDPLGGKHFAAAEYNPYFIQTEFEVLQSKAVLDKVAEKLKLNEKWGEKYGKGQELKPEETVALLKQKLDVRPAKNTSLLEIGVKSAEPEEAALIANTVAEVYQQYRKEQREKMSRGGIKVLQDQFSEQDKEISQLQQEVDRLRPAETTGERVAQPQAPTATVEAKRKQLAQVQAKYDRFLQTAKALDVSRGISPNSIVVMERAKAEIANSPTLWERTKSAVGTGEVERSARLMVSIPVAISDSSAAFAEEMPNFLGTQAALMKSGTVLARAAERLKLPPAKAAQLKDKVDVSIKPGTTIFDLRVKGENADEAARIANAVAEEFLNYKQEMRASASDSAMAGVTEEILQLERELRRAEDELARVSQSVSAAQPQAEPPPPPKPPANAPVPQPEIASAENAFSTFSLNVADVSFKLAQASLEQGQMPDAAAIRSEEFINAFDYRDPEAAPGQPVAFAWERARFPFAHNRDALRFSVKTAAAGRAGNRPLNLVLLLDNSGSMERADRVLLIQQALRVLASQLQPQDKISVVTFARTPRLWLDAVPGGKAGEALEQIGTLTPQGGTDLGAALNLAYQTALRHYLPAGMNRVVVLTDGAANLGDVDPDSLKRLVEQHRKQGVALDCFGIGWEGYNDDLLEMLTRNGDGRYGFVNTPEAATTEFAAQLAGALQVAASDVKVQVEFNPARVTNWRQVGYAKHQLTKEQFRDNTVDAAEIAAQEAGNGLYVIEVNPNGQGNLATVRVRYKVPGTSDYRELEWPVPYTGTAVPLEQASPAMRLLVASAGFSEWLASSPFSAEVSPDRLLRLIGGVPEVYGADEGPKKLEWMIRQAKSLSGK